MYDELTNTRVFFPGCHQDYICETRRHLAGSGDWKTHFHHHEEQRRNHLPVSEAVGENAASFLAAALWVQKVRGRQLQFSDSCKFLSAKLVSKASKTFH